MANWEEWFESVGDNCELGFMQRQKGVDSGAVLKWCRILRHADLLRFLDRPKDDFYKLENLKPTSNDMVEDVSSGIQFHTELYSRLREGERAFTAEEAEIKRIYGLEYTKRTYLYDKFIEGLSSGSRVHVFKMNGTNDLGLAGEISARLCGFNPVNRLFYITDTAPSKAGSVERISENIYRGYITSFAPYWPVTDAKLEYWDGLCNSAAEIIEQDLGR